LLPHLKIKLFVYRVGGFNEEGAGTPEDLIFFYNHLDTGGEVKRVNEELLLYRYHPLATTHSILEYVPSSPYF